MPTINDSKCILVTGATAGIGRALALAIHALPSKPTVIATGRRKDRLEELSKQGLEVMQIDTDADKDTLEKFVQDVLSKYPKLDGVIFAAGIQHEFEFLKNQADITKIVSEVNINYISIITMISFFLPYFVKLGSPCFISPVTSGLAIVPGPWVPNYSATKAALHSLCMSLRSQLHGTNVYIMEICPPLVESELHDPYGTTEKLSKFWMPLDEYTNLTMEGLKRGDSEITAGQATEAWQRFVSGKQEVVTAAMERRNKW